MKPSEKPPLNRVALVTGANRGIGLGLVRLLLPRGYIVYGTARNPAGARDLWELESEYPERFRMVELDVADEAQVNLLPGQISEDSIDLLFNNAGICPEYSKNFTDLQVELIRKTFEVNAIGPLQVTRALLPKLRAAKLAKVVNVSSSIGSIEENRTGKAYGYRMAKAALNMLSKTLSIDFPDSIFVSIHPGWVNTDLGGAQAPTSVLESTEGIIQVVERLTLRDSGRFYDFEGQELQW